MCLYGEIFEEKFKPPVQVFLAYVLPVVFVTIIAHKCDKLTYNHVKNNTMMGYSNQIFPIQDGNVQTTEELTEYQREVLKIPLNAVKASLLSFSIFGFFGIMRILRGSFLTQMGILQVYPLAICSLQGLRIIVILTCLHKANESNQAEISRSERRAQRQEWERTHSFRAERIQTQEHRSAVSDGHLASSSRIISPKHSSPKNTKSFAKRQILDPQTLEKIIEETSV